MLSNHCKQHQVSSYWQNYCHYKLIQFFILKPSRADINGMATILCIPDREAVLLQYRNVARQPGKCKCIKVLSCGFILQLASKIQDIIVSNFCWRKCKVAASTYCATTPHIKAWPLWFWYNHRETFRKRQRHSYPNICSSSNTVLQFRSAINLLKKNYGSHQNHIWSSHAAF